MSNLASPQFVAQRIDAPAALRFWHLASFDAPTVALVWSLALARAAEVRLPAWVPLLLALGTWAVYAGDRLLDARRALRTGSTGALRERHWFHWQHRRVLVQGIVVAGVVCVALVLAEMPVAFRARNSMLALAALAYFSGVHLPMRPRWIPALGSKELLVGLLFAAGCALPSVLRADAAGREVTLMTAAFLALVAWLNCHAIDRWEASPAARIAAKAYAVALAGTVVAYLLHGSHPAAAALAAAGAASALLLAVLDSTRGQMAPITLRVCADLVLLTPVLLLR